MRTLRWVLVITLLFLEFFVMHNHVWHLLARVDLVGGSTGWYRYLLMDEAFNHLRDWWLVGTQSTDNWGAYGCPDITNQYVYEAVFGGLGAMLLFIWIIVRGYSGVGRLWRECASRNDTKGVILSWGLGSSLFVHTMDFFAVSYFGQTVLVPWYLLLGTIGSFAPLAAKKPVVQPQAEVRLPVTSSAP